MRFPVLYALAIIAVGAAGRAPAHAGGALEEISAGNAPHAQGSPSSTWIADRLAGIWEPGDDWQLRLDLTGTRYFHIKASDMLLANLSVEYDPDAHWVFRLAAGGSPASTTESTAPVQVQDMTPTPLVADVELQTASTSASGSAWVGYDTAGDGALETSVIASASVTALDVEQQITSVQGRNGQMVTLAQLRTFCASHLCANGLGGALDGQALNVLQLVLGAGISEQLFQNTDVGLDGSYYLYDKDPTQVGTFSFTRAGQTATAGGGIGLAPVQYSVTPSLAHRLGPVMAMTSIAYSKYIDDQGHDVTATLRLQYMLALSGDRRLKLWGKVTGSRDVDQQRATSKAGSAALGVQYGW